MSIKTTRSVIDIGTSKGITLPANELKRLGISTGDQVEVVLKVVEKQSKNKKIEEDYANFVDQYGETLKNLSQR